jgi:hypothetical protein
MPQPATPPPPPHSIAQSQPLHFQDFSIQTISNQELAPPPPGKPIRMKALPPKYGGGGWHAQAPKNAPPSPPPQLFSIYSPILIQ